MSLLRRMLNLFSRTSIDREIEAELQSHVELRTEYNLAAGMSPGEARRDARIRFGNPISTRERVAAADVTLIVEGVRADIAYACRQLRRNSGFAGTAILVLALGLGASVAIFAFVDAALIKPLPYQDPSRLVSVFEETTKCPHCNVSYLNFRDWKRADLPFRSLDAWAFSIFLLPTSSGAEPAAGARVSDGFFRTLGVTPMLGRDFYEGEDTPGAAHSVLISYPSWKKRFGANPAVIGQTIKLSEETYTIVGVLPPEFHFAPRDAEFWAALNEPTSCELRRGCHNLFGVARLKDGVSESGALAAMKSIAQRLEKQFPENRGYSADLASLGESISGGFRPILLALLGGAGLLLLIACVNVSSLLLLRCEGRKREFAIRGALGASRARLFSQFVIEGLVLVAVGSVLGVALASVAVQSLVKLLPADMLDFMPYLQGLSLNPRVLGFAAVLSLLAVLLFSITPALQLSRSDMQANLSAAGRTSAGTMWRRLGSRLVVVEMATAVVLLVGAGLLSKSLYRLLHVDTGMSPENLATLQLTLPNSYQQSQQIMQLERLLVSRLRALPGVRSVGITTSLPSSGWGMATNIVVAGHPWNGEHNTVPERDVSSDYLRTLGAKLLRGRYFAEAEDDPSKPYVGVINQSLAKQYFPGEDAVGKHLLYEGSRDSIEIVGVIEDVKEGPLDTVNQPVLYDPFSPLWFRSFNLIVRTSQSEQSVLPTLVAAVHQINSGIATSQVMSMNDRINETQSAYQRRSSAWLIGSFALLALLLSAVGLYGVVAYSVSQRSREIGIRMALGAERRAVCGLILKEAARLIAVGIVVGLICSVAAANLIQKLLYNTRPWDASILSAVAFVLALCAMCASFLPARRAASVNPVEALRAE